MQIASTSVFIIGAFALYSGFLWAVSRMILLVRERVTCPGRRSTATVTFMRGPDGNKADVVRCSLEPRLECAKRCLRPA